MIELKALVVSSIYGFLPFLKIDIRLLQQKGYAVYCAANGSKDLGIYGDIGQLDDLEISKVQIDFARFPFSKTNILAYMQLKKIISENHFDLIHCHTPISGILTRLAARKVRKKGTKVIYTAHGFHFYKGAPLLNWLLYYPAEKICSYFTDVLITINKEDYVLAKKKMKAKQIYYIPGIGVETEKFASAVVDRQQLRKEINIPPDSVMLLSVGELNKNKNHEIIIRAIAKLNNPKIQYAIAGKGELNDYLINLASELGVKNQIHLLGFRDDVTELYKTADIYCFPSYREGLSVSLIEAMSSCLPVLCSKIRGNSDLIEENDGGFFFNPNDKNDVRDTMEILIDNPSLCKTMGNFNLKSSKKFDKSYIIEQMELLYNNIIDT